MELGLNWQPLSVSGSHSAAAAKSLQSCPTLCDPIDGSPPGSPIPGILQARTLEWVAISFSSAWKWKVKVKSLSHVWLFTTPWTTAYQAPLSKGFSRQEYWSGVPSPSPSSRSVRSNSFWPIRLICPWDSPGKNTAVGCHSLLQGFSQPRDRTPVSCIAGRFFTSWITREGQTSSLAGSKAHSPSTVSVVSVISFISRTQGKLSFKSDPENRAQSLKSLSSIFGVRCCS